MPNHRIVIGALEGDHVSLTVFGYEAPLAPEPKDANWLSAELGVSAGAWSGRVREAFVTTAELAAFLAEVLELEAGKRGDLQFEPMEPHLVLKLRGELGGRVEVSGVAFDEPEGVNALAFNWLMEGKQLKPLIKQLKDALKDFPAR